jgi:hypothetical protein
LAAGALEGRARADTLAHVAACSACASELRELEAALALLAADPLLDTEAPLPLPVLVSRVGAVLDERTRGKPGLWAVRPLAGVAALLAAAVAAAVLLPRWPFRSATPVVSEEIVARLERNLAREQAARYLGEAQDVLVSVAATPRPCDREKVDLGQASERSRELLTRGALLVDPEESAVAAARPVLNDVEQALREVAALESCARPRQVQQLREELARHQLLMKIRLMQRELEG